MESSSGTTAELEGSTLGRKSRDDSQPNLRANRNQTSGGFLLESAYSRNSRHGHAGSASQYTHGTNSEKRGHADDELIVPKRRSPSYRGSQEQRRSFRASPLAAVTNASASEGHDSGPNEYTTSRRAPSRNSYSSNVGLDTDPVQIVNLALNLSESRRRATVGVGRTPSSPLPSIPRNTSNSQVLFSTPDNAHRLLAGNNPRHSSLYTQDNRYAYNTRPLTPPLAHEPSPNNHGVAGILPTPDLKDVEIVCSQATLVRVQKAKQHFELFSKYLELLSYLPPLNSQARPASGRAYNPLQAIRNRKIRLREKNVANLESEGWQDVSRVADWLRSVEETHEQNIEDPYECLSLPSFPSSHDDRMIEHQEPWHTRTTSPSSSARETTRSGTKIQRPRLEWAISPAELLADAVWLEHGSNKAKAVGPDGAKLYADPTKLKLALPVSYAGYEDSAYQNMHALTKEPITPSNFNKRTQETLPVHGYQWATSLSPQSTPNEVTGVFAPKWTRSSSVSDDSSSDDIISRGRSRRARKKIKSEAAMQAEKLHRVLKAHSDSSNTRSRRAKPLPHPSSAKSGKIADKTNILISPGGSATGKEDRRMSVDEMDSTAPNSPMQGTVFPKITANLSPPSSRSPSPRKKLPRVIESLHERTRYRRHSHVEPGEGLDESLSESSQVRKRTVADSSPRDNGGPKFLEPSPIPEPVYSQEDVTLDDIRTKMDSHGVAKLYTSHESRIKGFLKNSRIAEIVGSEVSKVGDLIRRKEGGNHSRQSSYASSIVSDYHESDEEGSYGDESIPSKQASLRRGSTLSDDEEGFPWHRSNNGRTPTKSFANRLLPIGPTNDRNELAELDSLQQQQRPDDTSRVSNVHFVPAHPRAAPPTLASSIDTTPYSERRDSYGFRVSSSSRPELQAIDSSISTPAARLPRPPVTGLAKAEASRTKRPTLSTGSHGWTLSDRSIPTVDDPNLVEKREVLRYKAFLLSSGIKASALVHRFEEPRNCPPPQFLLRSLADDKDKPPFPPIIPRLSRIDEFNYAARTLLERLETTKTALNKSMYRFSKSTLLPLERDLDTLEDLINNSLTPRVRAAALEAESLSTQLNTTSTLAIKQLSDTLDKGLRKRNRRLRSIRRVGFMLLEWVLVGVMWWVWLIVMVFKVIRGIGMGVVKGIRWVLWV